MKKTWLLFTIILFGFTQTLVAQNLKEAHSLFEKFAYADAIPIYEKYLKSHDDQFAEERLADCYRMINKPDRAEKWYEKVMRYENKEAIYLLYYAQVLHSNDKCEQAKEFATAYLNLMPNDDRGKSLIEACDNVSKFEANAIQYEVNNAPLNSPNDDWGPIFYSKGLVFASDRSNGKKIHDWSNKPFLDVYYIEKKSSSYFGTPQTMNGDFKAQYHVGPVCFNNNGTAAYITRNQNIKNKKNATTNLDLCKAIMKDGKWDDLQVLPFCSNNYSVMHPALSPEGDYLYFASDMPGGFGGFDIYRVRLEDNGYGEPENLGNKINTEGGEATPFIAQDGTLYYSSRGLPGMGGADIFYSKPNGNGFSSPQNIGAPINSNKDDFTIIWNKDMTSGYFASDRPGGNGGSDIYSFEKTSIVLSGNVIDKNSGAAIPEANVTIFKNGETVNMLTTDKEGRFTMSLEQNQSYKFQGAKENYIVNYKNVNTNDGSMQYDITIPLSMKEQPVVQNTNTNTNAIFKVEGTVRDKNTGRPVPNASINIVGKCDGYKNTINTNNEGFYSFEMKKDCSYDISAQRDNYFTNATYASSQGYSSSQTFRKDIELQAFEIGKAIRLDNIYYDVNKWNIRPDAAKELDKLVKIMRENPGITIELSSHTDSRASDQYNLDLSSKRAVSAVEYIIMQGVASNRLRAVGMGEMALVNQCANGVNCTETMHQQNRRTEFKVLSFDNSANTTYTTNVNTNNTNTTTSNNIPNNNTNNTSSNNTSTQTNVNETNNTETLTNLKPSNTEVFRVQVKIVREFKSADFAAVQDLGTLSSENTGSGFNRILIGDFATLNDAKTILKYAKERGYPDAYIVSYINGERGRIY